MALPKIYLDTTVLKFSATRLPRFFPRQQTIKWGGRTRELTVHDFGYLNPNESIRDNPKLKAEADLLPQVAELAKERRIVCVIQMETHLESLGLPKMDSECGPFYGAPIEHVEAPLQYGRIVFSFDENPREAQLRFLMSLKQRRFAELQRMTGAYQGPGRIQRNQLMDAFHIWCAEHNRCDFFLCPDFKLQNVVARAKHKPLVRIVVPSELLEAIQGCRQQ